ncbi:MAG: sigma-54 dependent transcriptional regulator [Rhodospirillaceae bacterium]|nr:sigma-54 dependent transcriptional regulator [Rhodospirillaceae bacterium]
MSADILIVDDETDIRLLISGILEDDGYRTRQAANAEQALDEVRARAPSVILLDIWLEGSSLNGLQLLEVIHKLRPHTPIIMISGHGTIEMAVNAIKIGAYDFIEKPFEADRLMLLVERAIESADLRRENFELRSRAGDPEKLIGDCSAVIGLKRTIARVGPTGSRVLIQGPAGSGKEIVARHIHKYSKRSKAPFVVVNCASLQSDRLQGILFGEGGEALKTGLLDQADGGTLLLDEVADMPLETQSRVVRILQDQRFERGNGQGAVEVDIRIIATTNRDLRAEIRDGRFREELFYRLSVVPLDVPPLSDRIEDIPKLAQYFMERAAKDSGTAPRMLAPDTVTALQSYVWPGNARQLRNVIDWLLIMAPGEPSEAIRADMLPVDLASDVTQMLRLERSDEIMMLPLREAREMFEREYLMAQVIRYGGNISRTALFVEMERSALHRKLKSLGVTTEVRLRRADATRRATTTAETQT